MRFVTICLALLFSSAAFAQTGTEGSFLGIVKDSSGAIIPGVPVVVRSQATNNARNTTSNESGDYTVPLLPPGVYEVSISQPGFRNAIYSNVTVDVNQTVRVELKWRDITGRPQHTELQLKPGWHTVQLGSAKRQVTAIGR